MIKLTPKKYIFIAGFACIIFFVINPIYNPYRSGLKHDVTSIEYGLNVVQDKPGEYRRKIVVLADVYYSDSCYFLAGKRTNPIDNSNGACPDPWCKEKEGYFIINKLTGNIASGLSREEYLQKINKLKPFMLSDPDSFNIAPLNRLALSAVCPVHELFNKD